MANINLLPWRAERRKQREREFYMMLLATAVSACVVVGLAIFFMNHLIDEQNDRNAYLQTEIKGLDKQIEEIKELDKTRSQLLTRKDIIEQLQANRAQMVHLFDEMVKTIPDGARLTSMKQGGEILTLEGLAESNSRVATYMRSVDVSPWMGHSDLRKIENKAGAADADKKMPYVFSLDVKLRKPQDAQESAAAKTAGTAGSSSPAAAAEQEQKKPADLGAQLEAAASQLNKKTATPDNNKPAPAPQSPQPAATPATGEKK